MKRTCVIALAAASLLCAGQVPPEAPATHPAEKPRIYLALTDGKYAEGVLLSIDKRQVVLQVGQKTRSIPLDQIKPVSIYMARRKLADLTNPSVLMELGKFLLKHGELSLAQDEFKRAVRLDPGLAAQVEALVKSAREPPTTKQPGTQPKHEQPQKVVTYKPASAKEIAANQKRAQDLAQEAKAFAPELHLVETRHFLIFSTWPRSNDAGVADLCEKMHRMNCRKFEVRRTEDVFAGKCPVFLFWEKEQFRTFAAAVDKDGMAEATGYVKWSGSYCHIVIGGVRTYEAFCEMLVHEGTHAFMGRYLSSRPVPPWLNEGLADYGAAEMVPRSWSARRHQAAVRKAMRENLDVSYIFEGVSMNDFDYGIAHSLVRFMIESNGPGFAKFVKLVKEGKSEQEALKESFDCTGEQFLQRWRAAAAKAYGR